MACWRVSDLQLLLREAASVTAGALDPHGRDALRVTDLEIRREHAPPDKHLRAYAYTLLVLEDCIRRVFSEPRECSVVCDWYYVSLIWPDAERLGVWQQTNMAWSLFMAVLRRRSCWWFHLRKFTIQSERDYWRVFLSGAVSRYTVVTLSDRIVGIMMKHDVDGSVFIIDLQYRRLLHPLDNS